MAKLIYILGWLNLAGVVLLFLSCRCLIGWRLFSWLVQFKWYKKFYQTHCYWWYLFLTSVALHAILALTVYGNPFK